MRRRRTALLLAATCTTLATGATASASGATSPTVPRIVTRISVGTSNTDASFVGASADGSRVWYQTTEAIPGTGDTDAALDIYERRADGTTRLVSAGTGNFPATFVGASADGSRVWYQTREAIPGTNDTDNALDIYERRADGSTRLISAGVSNADAFFAGATADGSRVWYDTTEAIPGTGDTDSAHDIYERWADGSTRLISAGVSNADAFFAGASSDGSRVWYTTTEAIPGTGDTDAALDVYERSADGMTRLISVDTPTAIANFVGASADGSRVWFYTADAIPNTGDADLSLDIYERRSDTTTRLVSAGSANIPAFFDGATADGSRVWYDTAEAIGGTGDSDGAVDVFERRADGATRLVSAGTGNVDATFDGASADGRRIWYQTTEAIPHTGDVDASLDIYERRADGGTRLISAGSASTPAYFAKGSADGNHVWYRTTEAIPGTGDTDTATDVYERDVAGRTLLVTPRTAGVDVLFAGASRDGGRVWFLTNQSIPGTGDANSAYDVYESAVPPPRVARRARITGVATVGRTLTCSATLVAAESTTYVWKRGSRPIAHATKRTYTASALDRGRALRCTVIATSRTSRAITTSPARTVR